MEIVGIRDTEDDRSCVETIDIWYSQRRQAWFVERLDADGNQIGVSHRCLDEEEVSACLAEWLRAHEGARVLAPQALPASERRVLSRGARRAA